MRTKRFFVKRAVTPAASLYAAFSKSTSFMRSTPRSTKLPDGIAAHTLRQNATDSE